MNGFQFMSKKKNKKGRTLSRVVTLVLGLGFAASTIAIALSSVFSQNNYNVANPGNSEDATALEEQMRLQASGYEKVLAREPNNITALEGLTQIYLQTGQPQKAIPTLEKLVEYYPEQQEYAGILQIIKQQEANQSEKPAQPEATSEKE